MPTTDQQRRAIAYLTRAERDATYGAGAWDEPGVMAALNKVRHLNVGIVTMAAIRCAADPTIKTPAMIGDPSSSVYDERVGPERARRNPKREDSCRTCGRELTDSCCDRPSGRPDPSADLAARAAEARALLHSNPDIQEPPC